MNIKLKAQWTFVIMTSIIVFYACRKTDQTPEQKTVPTKNSAIEERFFKENAPVNVSVQSILDKVRRDNDKLHFVESIVQKVGYPYWDKAVVQKFTGQNKNNTGDGTQYFIIPFVRDSQQYVNAELVFKIEGADTLSKWRCDWQYKNYNHGQGADTATAEHYVLTHMIMNYTVFGDSVFKLTDTTLFSNNTLPKTNGIKLKANNNVAGKGNSTTTSSGPLPDNCVYTTGLDENGIVVITGVLCLVEEGTAGGGGMLVITTGGGQWWYYDESGGGNPGGGNNGGGGYTPPDPDCGPPAPLKGTTNPECGPGYIPFPEPILTVNYLANELGLSSSQITFLIQNPPLQSTLYYYLSQNNSTQSVQICKDHIDLLMTEPEYVQFVNDHNSTGNPDVVWWMDDIWLDNPQYFNLDPYDDYKKLTAAEKALVKQYPTAAFIMNKFNRPMATNFTVQKFGSNGLNDKSDAFRHAFFQAVNTVRIGATLTQQFSDAHETETPNQLIKEKQMDLFNNSVGIAYGQTQSYPTSTSVMIADAVYIKVLNGELRYLFPIWPPKFSPSGQLINPSGDPNFYGPSCTNNPATATHGITGNTLLIPTNQ